MEVTSFYHVTSRCVRRAFLCGRDPITAKNYEHRKQWIENRIRLLSTLFAIDVCAYAVMSNHYHVVVNLAPSQANSWSFDDIVERWLALFKGTLLVQKYAKGEALSSIELETVHKTLEVYRDRLTSLSWFMRCLNEPIARRSNSEDNCTGHFWESRFCSQGLPTDKAVLSAMVYVDLNPIRAGVASSPETSKHTSIKERLKAASTSKQPKPTKTRKHPLRELELQVKPLAELRGAPPLVRPNHLTTLTIHHNEYLKLIEWSARLILEGKRGYILQAAPPILDRLMITSSDWYFISNNFEKCHQRGAFR